MALTVQSGNLVWQKVKDALSAIDVASLGANPAVQAAVLQGLKPYLATQKRNPDLYFAPIDGVYSASDGGNNANQVLVDAACTLYAIVLQKKGATETVFKGSNHATTATTDGTQDLAIAATVAGTVCELYPGGRALSAGLTVCENTTRTGSTKTLSANQMSGFAIVGA